MLGLPVIIGHQPRCQSPVPWSSNDDRFAGLVRTGLRVVTRVPGLEPLVRWDEVDLQVAEYVDIDQYLKCFMGGEDDWEIGAGERDAANADQMRARLCGYACRSTEVQVRGPLVVEINMKSPGCARCRAQRAMQDELSCPLT
jgi:hypothetical protein